MKNLNKYFGVLLLLITVMVIGLSNCTKHNQVLDISTPPAVLSGDTLFSMHVSNGPAVQPINGPSWDGSVDAMWNNAKKLSVHAVVPDLGNNTFTGFIGNSTDMEIRSMYDANNIYYLVEFNTPQKNVKSAQWYFNPTQTDMTKRWAQEATAASLTNLNPDGSYRPPFAQDQFVMMFNVANSCQAFKTLSCYAACHVMSSYGGTTTPDGGVMYTNGPTEILDVWRARMLQVANTNQLNDCFIDDGSSIGLGGSGTLDKNEVHGDWQVNNGFAASVPPALQSPGVAADGGFGNSQTLTITGTTKKAKVPLWVIPAGGSSTGKYSAIILSDTLPGGAALKVISVDSNGVLTLSNAATIDPRTAASGTAYQQVGTGDGPKCIPGSIVAAYTGSRGDVTANAFYTGTAWRIMLKRALKTADTTNDVDFSGLGDQSFGVGAMFNGADNQHAIVAGLTLHFQK